MNKFLIVLAILGTTTVPAGAQTAAPAANESQPAKPQMVKKRVCQVIEDDDPYSRLGSNRKICKTIEVPANAAAGQQQPAQGSNSGH
jgi:hypothetical protein